MTAAAWMRSAHRGQVFVGVSGSTAAGWAAAGFDADVLLRALVRFAGGFARGADSWSATVAPVPAGCCSPDAGHGSDAAGAYLARFGVVDARPGAWTPAAYSR